MDDRMNENANEEQTTVTLTLEDDTEVECMVLTIFPAGEREYIALLPMDSVDDDEGEVYLYRYEEDTDGNPNLTNIEDDDEYEIVSDAFEALIGAIYLDGGFTSAKEFVRTFVLNDLEHKKLFFDSKTILQERIQC